MANEITEIQKNLIHDKTALVIAGPTASGKTGAACKLAEKLDLVAISADSRQMYKLIDIGTAKPTRDELEALEHRFVDFLDLDEDYSAGKFGDEAEKEVLKIFNEEKVPVIVGGSGLYVKSLLEGLFEEEQSETKTEIRRALNAEFENTGIEPLYERLRRVDPESADKYSDKNPVRIIRALEYFIENEEPLSKARGRLDVKRRFNNLFFYIEEDRKKLYEKINLRAELMIKGGLIEELKRILSHGYSRELNSLNTVGYKEFFPYLDGEIPSEEALAEMQKNTRRYAKRQITWFKKNENKIPVSGSASEISNQIIKKLIEFYDS